jgi:hypothetical protein
METHLRFSAGAVPQVFSFFIGCRCSVTFSQLATTSSTIFAVGKVPRLIHGVYRLSLSYQERLMRGVVGFAY